MLRCNRRCVWSPGFPLKPLNAFLSRFARKTSPASAARAGSAAPVDIAATIDSALTAAGLRSPSGLSSVIDSVARRVPVPPAPFTNTKGPYTGTAAPFGRQPSTATPADDGRARPVPRGTSFKRNFKNAAGARAYTLYVPSGLDLTVPAPLVVMLHGCTQNPEDFAAGTGMNSLADDHGVLVAYPAQTRRDNGSNCWNWFRSEDQLRGVGEPSILAGIVADIAVDHRVDAHRVYVAGLSAGAAMAVILGRTYPDVFAAVGAHSGLPFGAAKDMPGAFAAMQGTMTVNSERDDANGGEQRGRMRPIPTIVFHGDADRTVNWNNGRAIADDIIGVSTRGATLTASRMQGSDQGRGYTLERYTDPSGRALVELWSLHGGGHAWSGGDLAGSYVDPTGPDASAEMLRFFLQHENAG